jgi:predicted nucleic acid-binding protein
MRLFLDTNVVLATVIDDAERADAAAELLDDSSHTFITSSINIMELRAVLTKKERLESERAERIVSDLLTDVDLFMPDSGDLTDAVRLQKETFLYPMDAIILACADSADATLVTFDGEILEHDAVEPSDIL